MLLPEGISMRSLFLWHQISDWDPFNLNATLKLHLPENFQIFPLINFGNGSHSWHPI